MSETFSMNSGQVVDVLAMAEKLARELRALRIENADLKSHVPGCLDSADVIRELVHRGDLVVVEERREDGKGYRRVLEDPKKRKVDKVHSNYDLRSKSKRYKLRVRK